MALQYQHGQVLTICAYMECKILNNDLSLYFDPIALVTCRSSHNSLHQVTRARDLSLQNHHRDRLPGRHCRDPFCHTPYPAYLVRLGHADRLPNGQGFSCTADRVSPIYSRLIKQYNKRCSKQEQNSYTDCIRKVSNNIK